MFTLHTVYHLFISVYLLTSWIIKYHYYFFLLFKLVSSYFIFIILQKKKKSIIGLNVLNRSAAIILFNKCDS